MWNNRLKEGERLERVIALYIVFSSLTGEAPQNNRNDNQIK